MEKRTIASLIQKAYDASVNSSSAHAPPGQPPGILKVGKFPGVGTREQCKYPGVGMKKEGKCSAPETIHYL